MLGNYMLNDCMTAQMDACAGSISPNGLWAAAACRAIADNEYPEVDTMLVLKVLHKQAEDSGMVDLATDLQRAFAECYVVHANKRSAQ
jgi:hypothetical protein